MYSAPGPCRRPGEGGLCAFGLYCRLPGPFRLLPMRPGGRQIGSIFWPGGWNVRTTRSPDSAGIRMPLTAGILAAMRYICFCDPKRLFSLYPGRSSLAALGGITESYLTTQLERGFSALDFYKSLLI